MFHVELALRCENDENKSGQRGDRVEPRFFGRKGMSNSMAVTDATFVAEIEEHKGLAVVDFWAAWCGPCRMIAPILDQLATEYNGKAKVAKVDVDTNQQTAMRFNVRSIPSILFFKDGKHVDTVVGAVQKAYLERKFAEHA
jgi:thioredoxin 1